MLSPVSFRICCIAAMAPALTEAASQAESFSLPHSPASSSTCISHPASPSGTGVATEGAGLLTNGSVAKNLSTELTLKLAENNNKNNRLVWNSVNLATLANIKLISLKELEKYKLSVARQPGNTTTAINVADYSKDQSQDSTMNKETTTQDSMGLINTNSPLRCDMDKSGTGPDLPVLSPGHHHPRGGPNNARNGQSRRLVDARDSSNPAALPTFESTSELHQQAQARRHLLEKRSERILRRIRKLQLRHSVQHIMGQLTAFVDHQQQNLSIPCQMQSVPRTLHQKFKDSADFKAELLQSEDVKNLSTAALVNLVRKLESSHGAANLLNVNRTSLQSSESQADNSSHADVPKLQSEECDEIRRVTGTLMSNIRHQECSVDSDVTESSSGGESCDELEYLDGSSRNNLKLSKRAAWRWALDRAAIASRWTWLHAQVSDIEFRIRQQNEICRQLRAAKGAVQLESDLPETKRPAALDMSYAASLLGTPGKADSDGGRIPTKAVNGFVESSPSNGYHHASADPDACQQQASRTRALKNFRKRKVVFTSGLYLVNRKAAKLSTVQCGCNSLRDLMPCVACGGKYKSVCSLEPDTLSQEEKVALLEPAFHPVLSLREDIPLSLHFESLLRSGELQKSAIRASASLRKKSRLAQVTGLNDQARKRSRKLARNAAQTLLSSAKIRRKYGDKRHMRQMHIDAADLIDDRVPNSRYRRSNAGFSLVSVKHRERQRSVSTASSGSSKAASPVPSPAPSLGDGSSSSQQPERTTTGRSALHDAQKRRRGESAFDINNIVIPYSIASSTRVEKIQYKEILTPKWRTLTEEELNPSIDSIDDSEETEDLSDELFIVRHQRCEAEEKTRFLSYSKVATHGRGRARGGLRADSGSGANTPDPLSPHPHELSMLDSPATSPPPATLVMHSEDSQPSNSGVPPMSAKLEKRRTASFSRIPEYRSFDVEEVIVVPPYEPRSFPLSDEEYLDMLKNSPHLLPPTEGTEFPDPDKPLSPASSSSSSGLIPDDPNDPEWTVVTSERKSLILKLTKR